MKYIVLSFDDGLKDFKLNAIPVLNQYGVKACVNVISGFSDKTYKTTFDYLSIEDIQQLHQEGHEIAVHSDSHVRNIGPEDFDIAYSKISAWIGERKLGVVLPFSQSINQKMVEHFQKAGYLYLCDYSHFAVRRSWKGFLLRAKNHVAKDKEDDVLVSANRFVYTPEQFQTDQMPCFTRYPAGVNYPPEQIIRFSRMMRDDSCITIMLHSILQNEDEPCEWPEGAWTVNQLDQLLSFYAHRKDFKVVTQREFLNGGK